MELTSLAIKNKRVKDWQHFAESEIFDDRLKSRVLQTLGLYKSTLLKVWHAGAASAEDEQKILDFERQLEEFNEQARLRVGPSKH